MPNPTHQADIKVSNSVPRGLVDLLVTQGYESSDILRGTAIDEANLADVDGYVQYRDFHRVLENAIAVTNNPHLGFDFGIHHNTIGSGQLGLGSLACDTYYDSLILTGKYICVINPAIRFAVDVQESTVQVTFEEAISWDTLDRFMIETLFAVFVTVIQTYDTNIAPQLIYKTTLADMDDSKDYANLLKGRIEFNAPINALLIPKDFCFRKQPFRNPSMVKQTETHMDKQLEIVGNEQLEIIHAIESLVRSKPEVIPTRDDVADIFNLTPRTLNRRLQSMDTNFKDIVSEVRKKIAIEFLSNKKYSIDEISHRLGYKDASYFSKAFSSWTGQTPSQFRKKP